MDVDGEEEEEEREEKGMGLRKFRKDFQRKFENFRRKQKESYSTSNVSTNLIGGYEFDEDMACDWENNGYFSRSFLSLPHSHKRYWRSGGLCRFHLSVESFGLCNSKWEIARQSRGFRSKHTP